MITMRTIQTLIGSTKPLAKSVKGLMRARFGFTLVETLVALGILVIVTAGFGSAFFQAFAVQRFWRDDMMSTKEWSHAQSYFAGDVMNAQTTNLVDGAPSVTSVTLDWTANGVPHTATYSLSGTTLSRAFDGQSIEIARQVVAVGFSLSGRTVTFDLTVKAGKGDTVTKSLTTYLRVAP